MKTLRECTEANKNKEILLEDKKVKFRVKNPGEISVEVVTIDGCVFDDSDSQLRCDYLLFLQNKSIEIYVELKGKNNIKHAVEQIESTIKHVIEIKRSSIELLRRIAYIIGPRVPNNNPGFQKQKKDLFKNHRCFLRTKNSNSKISSSEIL